MWRMLQVEKSDTYVLATNRTVTVRDFLTMSPMAGFDLVWEGKNENECGINSKNGQLLVKINPKFHRPAEVDLLIANFEKAKIELGWEPKTTLDELCQIMVEADIHRNQIDYSF
jgi:GDPmannose 4,6-dehydratase